MPGADFLTRCPLPASLRWTNASTPIGRFPVAIRADADLVAHEIATRGYWELQYPSQLMELTAPASSGDASAVLPPPPATFLDVGANQGFYSLLFAYYGYNVLAIEPMLLNRRSIEASLCANPELLQRVTVLPVALGLPAMVGKIKCVVRADDRNAGNGKLSCSEHESCASPPSGGPHHTSSGRSHTGHPHRGAAGLKGSAAADQASHISICEPVTMSTLDTVLADYTRGKYGDGSLPLVAAKMDVEGFECNVIKGGPSLFVRHRPLLFVAEANRKPIRECLSRAATNYGYRVAPTQPRHSNGELGDVNWILVRQQPPPPQPQQQPQPRGGGGGNGGADACTWANGCCQRHPRMPACTRKQRGALSPG